jgi:hypothetical protein
MNSWLSHNHVQDHGSNAGNQATSAVDGVSRPVSTAVMQRRRNNVQRCTACHTVAS